MGDLSAHFSRREFRCRTNDGKPCPYCGGKSDVSARLIELLEEIREFVGFPLVITSGYRCPARNAEVGGAPNSAHLGGEAADIFVSGNIDRWRIINALVWCDVERYGLAKTFLHVDVSTTLPPGVAWGYWE